MRVLSGLVAFSAVCCLAGCTPRPADREAETGFDGWSWYTGDTTPADVGVNASWGSRNEKLAYLVVADIAATMATSISGSGGRTEYAVVLTWPKGQKAELRIETTDGRTGTAASAGQTYDLAQGAVFVLRVTGDRVELVQLKRDISELPAGVPTVVKLVRTDPDLLRLLTGGK